MQSRTALQLNQRYRRSANSGGNSTCADRL